MKMLNKIAILLIASFWQLLSVAQTDAVARLDTNSILIGDQVKLELSFTSPIDYKVTFPTFSDTLTGHIEIIDQSGIDSSYNASKTEKYFRKMLIITSFDSGYYAIPPIQFNYTSPGDPVVHFTETEALLLEVHTLKVDMAQDLKDIKGPVEAPFTFREALPYILVFLVIAIATFLLIYFIRKRKKAEPVFRMVSKPKVPPHQIAIEELEALRFKKLWQQGLIKEYHTELVDIIRVYLNGKFGIHAAEFTSDEILRAVNETATNDKAKQKLEKTLQLADMVKFAKYEPLPLEHDTSLNHALDFVNETKQLGLQSVEEPLKNSLNTEVELGKPEPAETSTNKEGSERKEVEDVQ